MFNRSLLIDTNLLVLFIVGLVNVKRIPIFKRTDKYTADDFELLVTFSEQFKTFYTLPHVMAEVSNLTDLTGIERNFALEVIKDKLQLYVKEPISSLQAARGAHYLRLGLVDAAIIHAAEKTRCHVVTDDLALYLALSERNLPVDNFSHLRAQDRGFIKGPG